MNNPSRISTIAAAMNRPGRRSGTALISSGPSELSKVATGRRAASEVIGLALRAVDGRLLDAAGLDTPLGQDLGVGAVVDHRLDRLLQRLLQRATGLGHHQPVRGR